MSKNLTGMKFGRLTALEPVRTEEKRGVIWKCRCECGGEKEVPARYLIRGQTASCGCIQQEHCRRKDITGERYGRLVAVSFCHYNEKHQDCWLFRCDCGTEKVLPAPNVKWGNTRSCGCLASEHINVLNRKDITGKRFGKLTAVRPTEQRDGGGSVFWECICDCGNCVAYSVSMLENGRVHSCGCLYNASRSKCIAYRQDLIEDTNLSSLVVSKSLRRNNTSGCTGVSWNAQLGLWTAYITFQKKRYYLGGYHEIEDAVHERKKAERCLHDPCIEENFNCMTEESREKFREYLLRNSTEADKEQA